MGSKAVDPGAQAFIFALGMPERDRISAEGKAWQSDP